MPKFEVSVDISQAVAIYEVDASNEEEAMSLWADGKFLSLEQVDRGEGYSAYETFDDGGDDGEEEDYLPRTWD